MGTQNPAAISNSRIYHDPGYSHNDISRRPNDRGGPLLDGSGMPFDAEWHSIMESLADLDFRYGATRGLNRRTDAGDGGADDAFYDLLHHCVWKRWWTKEARSRPKLDPKAIARACYDQATKTMVANIRGS